MYPTDKAPGYGIFVKRVIDGLTIYDIEVEYAALIKGRGWNILSKIFKYMLFYWHIIVGFFRKYDTIYIHYPNMALPILLPLLKLKGKKKVIANLHGEDLFYLGKGYWVERLGKLNEYFLKKYANRIVVPSRFFKLEILNRGICDESKLIVSPSGGVDLNLFYPMEKKANEKICLGFVGRIEHGKGWCEYLETLHLLEKELNFCGIIVGYGSLEDEMKLLIKRYALNDKVELVNGVPQSQLVSFYNRFDLLLFTTQLPESLGLVGIEAMACGIPVLGTNIGGLTTYIRDEYNGFLVSKGDVDCICEKVKKYAAMSIEEKKIISDNCLFTARTYASDKVVQDLSFQMKSCVLK